MVKVEIAYFDKLKEKDSHARYEIVITSLDSRPEMYEIVEHQEGNDGYFKVYRDVQTTSAISVIGEGSGGGEDPDYITLVGDEDKMQETINRIKEVIPRIMVLEEILEDRE